ncbi:TonB-dependent receptor [Nitrospirillum amazonense]|uniref:TonB-dependent receptor n=1 Tax=Nitrospirillum amazonense TaxID=28077 RepID=A0A560KGZ3_9PROT|nr:TonB-dependent receptor [Nitrospirillum amazonense]MDG3441597.1 TonB-dependent receptor [Nitrospirillum amazonense]TWB79910.1 TonB-dependent receptor [Nitrospirillum amazonense]
MLKSMSRARRHTLSTRVSRVALLLALAAGGSGVAHAAGQVAEQPPAPAADQTATPTGAPADQAAQPGTQAAPQGETAAPGGGDGLEEIIVSGFRRSLNVALQAKRESSGVVDSIVAEDIAKFPDKNLAESLQRIPGIAITRDAGEGRQISVRGLGPAFTRVRINGMDAIATTGSSDAQGGNNRSRAFDFNVFGSDLFSNLTVHKTQSADQEEGSLGAGVDLSSPHPLDFGGFKLAINGKATYNDQNKSKEPNGAVLVSDTFADGKLGFLVGLSYSRRDTQQLSSETTRWASNASNASGSYNGGVTAPSSLSAVNGPNVFMPRIPRYSVYDYNQSRAGLVTSLQWKPDEDTEISLDGVFSDLWGTRTENDLEAISFSQASTKVGSITTGKPVMQITSGTLDANGNLVAGTFNNVGIRSEARYDVLSTQFGQETLNIKHSFSPSFRMNALGGYSVSAFNNPVQTTITLDRTGSNGYSYDYRANSRLPVLSYGFDVTNPANWSLVNGLSNIRLRPNGTQNTYGNGDLDFEYDISNELTLKAGFQFKDFTFSTYNKTRASEIAVPNLPAGVSLASLTKIGGGVGGFAPAGTPTNWLVADIDAFANALNIYSKTGTFSVSQTGTGSLGSNYAVEEKDYGGYAQANFKTDRLGLPIRGDIGVRFVTTDQTSSGYQAVGGTPNWVTVGTDYHDVLPSMNLVGEVTDDFLIRAALAKVMVRNDLSGLNPGGSVNVAGTNRTVTSGNPYLKPIRANTADLSFEYYYQPGALISLGLFYKDINSYVQTLSENKVYNSSGLPLSLLNGTGLTGNEVFTFSTPVNTKGGDLKGLEVNFQQPFSFLPDFWSNFGILLNYTYVQSRINYLLAATSTTTTLADLVGLSKNAYNGTLYYDDKVFSARISAAYRSGYLTQVPGRNGNDVEGTNSTMNVDFASSYAVNERLTFMFNAINLTNECNDQYVGSVNRLNYYNCTGRIYEAGFSFKY